MVSVNVYAVRFGAPKNTLLWLDVISQLTSLRGIGTGAYLPMNVRGQSSKVPANPRFVSLELQPLRESAIPLVGIGQAPGDYAVLGNDKYLIPSVPPGKYRLEVSWAGESEIQPDGTKSNPGPPFKRRSMSLIGTWTSAISRASHAICRCRFTLPSGKYARHVWRAHVPLECCGLASRHACR
jgi:hypothetical protein